MNAGEGGFIRILNLTLIFPMLQILKNKITVKSDYVLLI